MSKIVLKTSVFKQLADTGTLIGMYLRIRDQYLNPLLLESSDYNRQDNSFSYICFDSIASFKVEQNTISSTYPDRASENVPLNTQEQHEQIPRLLKGFIDTFEVEKLDIKFINNGLFGYTAYDAQGYFNQIDQHQKPDEYNIPEICYNVYKYIIVVNHFKNELYILENYLASEKPRGIDHILQVIHNKNFPEYRFNLEGEEQSNFTDEAFLDYIKKGQEHCRKGDVYQIVPSRRFSQKFKGDDFNLYRSLRSINPSPYLFYFDYGNFKIFGSSPEAQLIIKDRDAQILPIAGTFKRTGDDDTDKKLAQELAQDEKENSEHVMLVDLARNDLSRYCSDVTVEKSRELQFFSHVIHLVSKVTGKLKSKQDAFDLIMTSFPAGTLTGAPKRRAMQLINEYEPTRRGFYGGAIGFIGFDYSYNHAIMIRSFLSKDHQLYYQAGLGLVFKSDPQSEMQEVANKLAALRKAIVMAQEI